MLPRPAGGDRLDAILEYRGDPLQKAITAARRKLAEVRKRGRRVRPAAALPAVLAAADADPVKGAVANTLLTEARGIVCRYDLKRDVPPPGPKLARKLGPDEPAEAVRWTAAKVWQALGYYAGCVEADAGWLTRKLSARPPAEVRKLDRQERRLRFQLDGLVERWRKAAAWRAADLVMPQAGRDERIIRYEPHLHKLLTSTLHELERLQVVRAGKDVPVPAALDVSVSPAGLILWVRSAAPRPGRRSAGRSSVLRTANYFGATRRGCPVRFDAFGYAQVRAGSVGRRVRGGAAAGLLPSVRGTWVYCDGVFTVSHPRPLSGWEVLAGRTAPAEPVTYPVPLLAPAAAPRRPRRWFGCPRCRRKCSDLYLMAPWPTLACRRCHGLRYSSQTASRSAREVNRRLRTGYYGRPRG